MPVIILAAGASVRMRGRDKLMELVDGKPLIARQAHLARQVTTGPVIITLPPPPHARHTALIHMQITPVVVPDAASGISQSLRAGISALPAGASHAMVLLGDLPALVPDDLRSLIAAVDAHPACLVWRGATATGKAGHPIIFGAALFPAFDSLSGDNGGRDVVRAAGAAVATVKLTGDHALLDLDTPEDWENWRRSSHRQIKP